MRRFTSPKWRSLLARLKVLSGADVCKILEANGFAQVRQKGSHAVMQKAEVNRTTTVPVPLHKELKIGTLQSIIRQSKLGRVSSRVRSCFLHSAPGTGNLCNNRDHFQSCCRRYCKTASSSSTAARSLGRPICFFCSISSSRFSSCRVPTLV